VHCSFQNGENLLAEGNPGCENVSERMKKLNDLWSNLLRCSSDKGVRLSQAAEQLRLTRLLEDEKLWLNDMETLLSSSDVGETLMDVKFLLRKQQVRRLGCSWCSG
jgi:spectrin beta